MEKKTLEKRQKNPSEFYHFYYDQNEYYGHMPPHPNFFEKIKTAGKKNKRKKSM